MSQYQNPTHETLGSDILAVMQTVKYPEQILGAEWVERLRTVEPGNWYPIALLLELLEQLVKRGGRASLLQMGRQLFRDSHQERLAPALRCAGDVLFGIDAMYRHANRGQNIGGWEVLIFGPGHAVLRKKTPLHCAIDEGFLQEALHSVGAIALIVQTACMQTGAKACEFEVRSSLSDARWSGDHAPKTAANTLIH